MSLVGADNPNLVVRSGTLHGCVEPSNSAHNIAVISRTGVDRGRCSVDSAIGISVALAKFTRVFHSHRLSSSICVFPQNNSTAVLSKPSPSIRPANRIRSTKTQLTAMICTADRTRDLLRDSATGCRQRGFPHCFQVGAPPGLYSADVAPPTQKVSSHRSRAVQPNANE
jgi:hypothetical protein